MIDPMTTATSPASPPTRRASFLAASAASRPAFVAVVIAVLTAMVAAVLAFTSSSASEAVGAENRVRASAGVVEVLVEPPQREPAGQRLGEVGPGPETAVATGVAANTGGRTAGRSCNSFTGDTLVLMADGSRKPIKDVQLGDWVMATDPETGEAGPRKVTDLIRHGGWHTMVAVRLVDGTTIDATDRHPFWVKSRSEWVDAIDLRAGDVLVAADGDRVVIAGVAVSDLDVIAYNLTVADLHTYHVSSVDVLVHNTGPGCEIGPDGWPIATMDNCEACADVIQQRIGGSIFRVSDGSGAPRLGPSVNDPDARWAEHFVVIRDGRAYDGFTGPEGMPLGAYRSQWEFGDYLQFTPK